MITIPTWVLWAVATLIATFPLSILYIARRLDKVRPKRRRAKLPEFTPLAVGEGVLLYGDEEELHALVHMIAQVQMRQMWGKDIAHIN